MAVIEVDKLTVIKLAQSLNTTSPRKVTDDGIETEINPLSQKAPCPIDVTDVGIFIEVSL